MLLGRNTSETTTCGVSMAHCTISRSEYDTNHSTMGSRSIIMKLALGAIAATLLSSTAFAADLLIVEPAVAPASAASGVRGVIELGAFANYVDETDEDFSGTAGGAYVSGAIWGGADGFVWGIDGYFDRNSFDGADAPNTSALAGLHAGVGGDGYYAGFFGSAGLGFDDSEESHAGYSVGVEGQVELDQISLFGQLGWADVDTEGDEAGFIGAFLRGGAVFASSDDFAIMADASYGYTESFEDTDDEGYFATVGVKAALVLPTDFTAFVTAGYEFGYYEATTEDDSANSHTLKLGLAIPFGDSTAADVLNPLATSSQPYRAATWADILD